MTIYTQCPELNDDSNLCPSCAGMGTYDIGDCEDGVWGDCPQCEGTGRIQEDN